MPRITGRHALAYAALSGAPLFTDIDKERLMPVTTAADVYCDSTAIGDDRMSVDGIFNSERAQRAARSVGWGVMGDVIAAAAGRIARRSA
jgi:hypothetical protein